MNHYEQDTAVFQDNRRTGVLERTESNTASQGSGRGGLLGDQAAQGVVSTRCDQSPECPGCKIALTELRQARDRCMSRYKTAVEQKMKVEQLISALQNTLWIRSQEESWRIGDS
jgi:hypothetical protein